MPTIQVRDVPQDVYDALTANAKLERRSLAQQVLVTIERGLALNPDHFARRQAALQRIRERGPIKMLDPVKLLREDRNR